MDDSQPLGFIAFWKATDTWFEAEEEEKERFLKVLDKIFEEAKAQGVRMHGIYDCSWSSEWRYFTFWECPDLETLEGTMRKLVSIGDINMYNVQRHFVGRRLEEDLIQ